MKLKSNGWNDKDAWSRSAGAHGLKLANTYQAVLISNVPKFTENTENEARRFIALVDEWYDSKIKLILSAELPIKELYQGHKLQFEFQRTASRIEEYQK